MYFYSMGNIQKTLLTVESEDDILSHISDLVLPDSLPINKLT